MAIDKEESPRHRAFRGVERETGLEPATTCLEARFVPEGIFDPLSPDLRQSAFVPKPRTACDNMTLAPTRPERTAVRHTGERRRGTLQNAAN